MALLISELAEKQHVDRYLPVLLVGDIGQNRLVRVEKEAMFEIETGIGNANNLSLT
jgi:hypothetical protein